MKIYDKIEDKEVRDVLKSSHKIFQSKNMDRNFLIFDDSKQICRNWKTPGQAFKIDDKRTKRMTVNLDKRSVFFDSELMLDSIVKIRSYPFGHHK